MGGGVPSPNEVLNIELPEPRWVPSRRQKLVALSELGKVVEGGGLQSAWGPSFFSCVNHLLGPGSGDGLALVGGVSRQSQGSGKAAVCWGDTKVALEASVF